MSAWPSPQKIFAALERACGRGDCQHVIEFDGSDVAIAPCRTCGRKWEVRPSGIRPANTGGEGAGMKPPASAGEGVVVSRPSAHPTTPAQGSLI